MKGNCGTCIYWAPPDHYRAPTVGDCHRHAPAVHTSDAPAWRGGIEQHTVWPATAGRDWCGDHEPKPEPPADPNH